MPKKSAEQTTEANEEKEVSGQTLSVKAQAGINQAIDALKACTAVLEKLKLQGGEGEEQLDEAAPEQRSTPTGSAKAGFDDWRFTREVLQAIATSASGALERFNKTAREQAQRK